MKSGKIAFVVQRYGKEVMGGSELHCRLVAEKLVKEGYDCTVFTTTAKDYITWKNEYSPGEFILNGVRIKRFSVAKERQILKFNEYSDWIFAHDHSHEDEIKWMESQGPYSPDLVQALKAEYKNYSALIFFTYLYYNTYFGLQAVDRNKVLVPTAHDEPALYLNIMKTVFSEPQSFIFNTHAELSMLNRSFSFEGKYKDIVGVGIDIPDVGIDGKIPFSYGLRNPYLLYAGRIEPGKGCCELFEYFEHFISRHSDITLALIGKKLMDIPDNPNIRYLGFIPPEHKNALMASAFATVHPSPLESLCMASLESLAVCTPILVREDTAPLKQHVIAGKSGLYYSNSHEFEESVSLLLSDKRLRETLGKNGCQYVKDHYSWPVIIDKYNKAINHLTKHSSS